MSLEKVVQEEFDLNSKVGITMNSTLYRVGFQVVVHKSYQ